MRSDYIKIVNESDFEYEVIAYSRQAPVIVDFWAEWCKPCKSLTPLLEKFAIEGQGSFMLAKVNVDDNPNLALRYGVRSIPNVKAFRDGQVVSEFLGLQPEPRVKEFIHNLAPSQIDLLLEKGQSLLESMSWAEAGRAFAQFLQKSPGHPAGQLGLLKASLMLGRFSESRQIIAEFPSSPEYARMEALRTLLNALWAETTSQSVNENPLDATYQNALRLILRGNIPAAMDGIIDILRQDKHYRNEEARRVLLSMFEILGDGHPLTQQYRRELAMALF